MRTVRTLSVRRRDRLEDLDASNPAEENPMRICRQDQGHRAVAGGEQRLSNPASQRGDDSRVAAAHARI